MTSHSLVMTSSNLDINLAARTGLADPGPNSCACNHITLHCECSHRIDIARQTAPFYIMLPLLVFSVYKGNDLSRNSGPVIGLPFSLFSCGLGKRACPGYRRGCPSSSPVTMEIRSGIGPSGPLPFRAFQTFAVQGKNCTTSNVGLVSKPAPTKAFEMLHGFTDMALPQVPFPDKLPS
jgi:hypothetical protein